jgi:hypothetical protein
MPWTNSAAAPKDLIWAASAFGPPLPCRRPDRHGSYSGAVLASARPSATGA